METELWLLAITLMEVYNEKEQMGWYEIHNVWHEYKEGITERNVAGKTWSR